MLYTLENGKGSVTIFNTAGQLVVQQQIQSDKQQINVARLPKGVYMLKVKKANGQLITRQFVK